MTSPQAIALLSIGLTQLLAVISPGPSFLITARTSVAISRAEGLKVALGLGAGTVIWAGAALLGLKLLFEEFHWLFIAAKLVGALFLMWVAWNIFRHASDPIDIDRNTGRSETSAFLRGFLVQITNPKVAIFFGSIFVAMLPVQLPVWMVVALLVIVTFNEIAWYSLVALFFGASPVRRTYLRIKVWLDRITGLFLGALGLRLLYSVPDAA